MENNMVNEMRQSADFNWEFKLFLQLKRTLINCGFPSDKFLDDRIVALGNNIAVHVDLAIMAQDGKTPLALFLVSLNGKDKTSIYNRVQSRAYGLIPWIPCFLITGENGKTLIANLKPDCPQWVDLDSTSQVQTLIGDYQTQSKAACEQQELRSDIADKKYAKRFSVFLGILGGIIMLLLAILEICHIVLSWKWYAFVIFMFALWAAVAGLIVRIKVKDFEIFIASCPSTDSKNPTDMTAVNAPTATEIDGR